MKTLFKKNKIHLIWLQLGLIFTVLALCMGCGSPNKEKVSQDFMQIFTKELGKDIQPIITSIGPGEGDSDNVYEHIQFDIIAKKNLEVKNGWLAGTVMSKDQKLYNGEVVMLYQKTSASEWIMKKYDLTRIPSNN